MRSVPKVWSWALRGNYVLRIRRALWRLWPRMQAHLPKTIVGQTWTVLATHPHTRSPLPPTNHHSMSHSSTQTARTKPKQTHISHLHHHAHPYPHHLSLPCPAFLNLFSISILYIVFISFLCFLFALSLLPSLFSLHISHVPCHCFDFPFSVPSSLRPGSLK